MGDKDIRNPTPPTPRRRRCEVCGQPVYSAGGIHPQCSVRRAEASRPKADEADPPAFPPGGEPED